MCVTKVDSWTCNTYSTLYRRHSNDDNFWDVILNLPDCSHFLMRADIDIFIFFCTTLWYSYEWFIFRLKMVMSYCICFRDWILITWLLNTSWWMLHPRWEEGHTVLMVELTVCTHFTSIYSYHEFIKPNPKVKKRYFILVHVCKNWCWWCW